MMRATADHFLPSAAADETRTIVARVSDLIRAEYTEMPCLSLTLAQAMRLWNVNQSLCEMGLAGLVREGFLKRSEDGRYRLAKLRRRSNVDRRS